MFTMFKIRETSQELVKRRKKDEWEDGKIVPFIQNHNFYVDFVKCIAACLKITFTWILS